jgi:membrane fusion protein, copper/silver efflux system
MRSYSWIFAISGLALGAGLVALLPEESLFSVNHDHAAETAATGERWACPMMDYIGTRAGTCPVCGMDLAKVTAGELTAEQQRRMGVQLTQVTEGPARITVRAYGAVKYDDRTLQVVIPRIGGRVVKRHDAARHMGTDVQEGDAVVDLYSPEAFAAQGELAAAVKLNDQPTIQALTERFQRWNLPDVAKAILEGGVPVDTVTIRTPFAGRVIVQEAEGGMAEQLPQVGQEVTGESPLVRVVDPSAYMLVVHVPEPRVHSLRVGQPVRLASDDRGELPEVDARVSWLAPELNLEIRAREVHIHLRDPKNRLLPGSLVNARFDTALTQDLTPADATQPSEWGKFPLVPKTAILSTGVRNVAWKVVERQPDGRLRFELAAVALGPRIEDEAGNDVFVVRAGLNPGDEVATQGVFLIDSQAQLAGTSSLLFPQGAVAPAGGHQH